MTMACLVLPIDTYLIMKGDVSLINIVLDIISQFCQFFQNMNIVCVTGKHCLNCRYEILTSLLKIVAIEVVLEISLFLATQKAREEVFAYLGDAILIDYHSRQKPCGMAIIGKPFFRYSVGFALTKGSALTEKLSQKVVSNPYLFKTFIFICDYSLLSLVSLSSKSSRLKSLSC